MPKQSSTNGVEKEFADLTFGEIVLRIYPFPPGLYDLIAEEVIEKYPLPEPPTREIKSFAGDADKPEVVIDFDDPTYVAEKKQVEDKRDNEMASKILTYTLNESCQVQTVKKMNEDIKRLGCIITFSDDEHERMKQYVKGHVLKTKNQYAKVIKTAIALSVVDEEEVAEAVKNFPD